MFGSDMSLEFRLFGIPIRVGVFFLLMAVLVGPRDARGSLPLLAIWVVVVFLGVLLHELGHALTARAFGQRPAISLHGLGGVTAWRPRGDVGSGKRLLIAFAGPATGILLGLIAIVAAAVFTTKGTPAYEVMVFVIWVNLGWGILNLLPMLPLDGGAMMASLFDLIAPGRGLRAARYISIAIALGVGVLAIVVGAFVGALLCGLFAYLNFQELRGAPPPAAAIVPPPQPPPVSGPPEPLEPPPPERNS